MVVLPLFYGANNWTYNPTIIPISLFINANSPFNGLRYSVGINEGGTMRVAQFKYINDTSFEILALTNLERVYVGVIK